VQLLLVNRREANIHTPKVICKQTENIKSILSDNFTKTLKRALYYDNM